MVANEGNILELSRLIGVREKGNIVLSVVTAQSKESTFNRRLSFSLAWAIGVTCWDEGGIDNSLCSTISDTLLFFRIGFLLMWDSELGWNSEASEGPVCVQ